MPIIIWRDGCFVSYADANATTPAEDALHWYVVSGTDPRGCSASGPDLQRLAGFAHGGCCHSINNLMFRA
jgi:hypothetical protein